MTRNAAPRESSRERSLWGLVTTYQTVAIALGVVLLAIGLLAVSLNDALWGDSSVAPALLTELGGLLFVSAALTLLWDLAGKRSFKREVLEDVKEAQLAHRQDFLDEVEKIARRADAAGRELLEEVWKVAYISEAVRQTGLSEAYDDFQKLDWRNFEGTKRFDAFFAGGTSFRRSHQKFFEDLEDTPGAEVNVYLPDPENPKIVKELELRFTRYTGEEVRKRLTDAVEDFRGMRDRAEGPTVNVWFVPFAPLYTFYRCDDTFVFTPYRHRPYEQKGTVPVFVFGQGGAMHAHFERELAYLETTGRDAFAPRDAVGDGARP